MPSRFDENPDEPSLMTPELAEQVVERFAEIQAERQRIEAAERERLASLTRVQDLADLLGTTSEEVQAIAKEVRENPGVSPAAPVTPTVRLQPERRARTKSTYPLHLGYLAALVAVFLWGAAQQVPTSPNNAKAQFAQNFGIDLAPQTSRFARETEYPMGPDLVSPPQGFRVTLVADRARRILVGPAGPVLDTKASVERMRASLVSLIRREEKRFDTVRTWDSDRYVSPSNGRVDQFPAPGGWHSLTIDDGTNTVSVRLPDRRFASRFSKYDQALKEALDQALDKRLVSSLPPSRLGASAVRLGSVSELPAGFAVVVTTPTRTLWVEGNPNLTLGSKNVASAIEKGLTAALAEVRRKAGISDFGRNTQPGVRLVYPGGETESAWPRIRGHALFGANDLKGGQGQPVSMLVEPAVEAYEGRFITNPLPDEAE